MRGKSRRNNHVKKINQNLAKTTAHPNYTAVVVINANAANNSTYTMPTTGWINFKAAKYSTGSYTVTAKINGASIFDVNMYAQDNGALQSGLYPVQKGDIVTIFDRIGCDTVGIIFLPNI